LYAESDSLNNSYQWKNSLLVVCFDDAVFFLCDDVAFDLAFPAVFGQLPPGLPPAAVATLAPGLREGKNHFIAAPSVAL